MDQVKQPTGKFIAFPERYKKAGDNRPMMTGYIAAPESDKQFTVALWAGVDKKGNPMLTGESNHIHQGAPLSDRIKALAAGKLDENMVEQGNLQLKVGDVVLFTNPQKGVSEKNVPHFYGYWNDNGKLLQISAWEREAGRLGGATQVPMPGKKLAELGMQETSEAEMATSEHAQDEARPSRRSRSSR